MRTRVNWENRQGTAVITIENPPVNVLDSVVCRELRECLEETRDDPAVSVMILTSGGTKAFMAGADIKGFPEMIGKPGKAYAFLYTVYEIWYLLEQLEKPVIAAINGLALGAGLEMALCCDLRIAGISAKLGLPEIKLGLFPGGGGTQRLPRMVGKGIAKEMILTGKSITAAQALQIGLVNQVVPDEALLSAALTLADQLGKFSPTALSLAKKSIDEGGNTTLREGIDLEARYWQEVFLGEDVREGVTAFLEKRQPQF